MTPVIRNTRSWSTWRAWGKRPPTTRLPHSFKSLARQRFTPRPIARYDMLADSGRPVALTASLQRLITKLLCGEGIDFLRRINELFPLADLPQLEEELSRFRSPRNVQRRVFRVLKELNQHLVGEYTEQQREVIVAYVNRGRDTVDFNDILSNALNWVEKGLELKIGLKVRTRVPTEGILEEDHLHEVINSLLQEISDYLAPLFDESREGEAARIFCRKPAYMQQLAANYTDAVSAACHVLAVTLNSVTGFFERAYSYDFKHTTSQYWGISEKYKDMYSAAFRAYLLGDAPILASFLDDLKRLFNLFAEESGRKNRPISVSRDQTLNEVFREIEERVAWINCLCEEFFKTLIEKIATATAGPEGRLTDAFFTDLSRGLLKKTEIGLQHFLGSWREGYIKASQTAFGMLAETPDVNSVDLGIYYGYFDPRQHIFLSAGRLLEPLEYLVRMANEFVDSSDDLLMGKSILPRIVRRVNRPRGRGIPIEMRLLYHDADIFSAYPSAPPAASGRNVIRLEVSTGCDWSRCSYCTLYKHERFSMMTIKGFRRHFALVSEFLGSESLAWDFDRVFLSGGNGLSMSTDVLLKLIKHIADNKGGSIRRIEIYARTGDIQKHGADGLQELNAAGLNLVYWGIESGSNDVLRLVRKGFTREDVIEAGELLWEAGTQVSALVMPGLGGIKYAESHVKDTAEVVGRIYPRYLTFMGVYAPGTPYEEQILDDPENRPLTLPELKDQIHQLHIRCADAIRRNPHAKNMYTPGTVITAHDPMTTPTAFNPLTLRSVVDRY